MLKPQIWLVALVVVSLCCLGLEHYWPATRARIPHPAYHLEVVNLQLDGLRGLLRDYRARPGRYPTAEEGLSGVAERARAATPARCFFEEPEEGVPESEFAEFAIAPNGALYILQGGEVLTDW